MVKFLIVIIVVAALGITAFFVGTREVNDVPKPNVSAPADESPAPKQNQNQVENSSKRFLSQEVPGVHAAYEFSAEIPAGWQVEGVGATEALNIFDPQAPGATNLEKSEIFVRYFRAASFLTLSTVTIHKRTSHTVIGRPAVTYDIEKKSGVADFPNQPAWRNGRHRVTDVRVSDASPSYFYVIAKRPELPDEEFERFLSSIRLGGESATLFYPIPGFRENITKKPFGILITPGTSPVQPERFRGYHAGVDVETPDADGLDGIPIYATAQGTVVFAKTASGYGGVVAIRHTIGGESLLGIYGHLNPALLTPEGRRVEAGEKIGVLGAAFSSETDGERRHLHFGLYRGSDVTISGYVQSREELTEWYDPVDFFKRFEGVR